MKTPPNKVSGANRRPASPFEARRQFASHSCAPAFLSAAGPQPGRSPSPSRPRPRPVRLESSARVWKMCGCLLLVLALRPSSSVLRGVSRTRTSTRDEDETRT